MGRIYPDKQDHHKPLASDAQRVALVLSWLRELESIGDLVVTKAALQLINAIRTSPQRLALAPRFVLAEPEPAPAPPSRVDEARRRLGGYRPAPRPPAPRPPAPRPASMGVANPRPASGRTATALKRSDDDDDGMELIRNARPDESDYVPDDHLASWLLKCFERGRRDR